jgi:hypothetical protein
MFAQCDQSFFLFFKSRMFVLSNDLGTGLQGFILKFNIQYPSRGPMCTYDSGLKLQYL